jgi:hypothetical protein
MKPLFLRSNFQKLLLFKDKLVLHTARYIYYCRCPIPVLLTYLTVLRKKTPHAKACMHAGTAHSKLSAGCERGVVCTWAFCRTPRVALCVGVTSMRLEGKGGGEERAGKMDKKLPWEQ